MPDTTRGAGQGRGTSAQELWGRAEQILGHELRGGCLDRTVIGGLEKFVSRWLSAVAEFGAGPTHLTRAQLISSHLEGYGAATQAQREARVRAALDLLARPTDVDPTPPSGRQPAGGSSGGRGDQVRLATASPPPDAGGRAKTVRPPRSAGVGSASPAAPDLGNHPGATGTSAARPRLLSVELDAPVVTLRGVGKQRAGLLAKLGMETVRDLLYHFPRDYRDYRPCRRVVDLLYGETASVVGVVEDVQVLPGPGRRFRTSVRLRDETGSISATWFRFGYGGLRVAPNSRIALAGTVSGFAGHLAFDGPDWEAADREPLHTRRMVPVYPLTEGISDYWLRELIATVVPAGAPRLADHLPSWIRSEHGLISLPQAVATIHFPPSPDELSRARQRLAFDELFMMQLAALKRRAEWRQGNSAPRLAVDDSIVEGFLSCQPFPLTGAQRRVVAEIRADIADSRPMTRLLQGEVGSGKTIVAAVGLLMAVASGYQAAMMAPTEILAEQHHHTLASVFRNASALVDRLLGRPLRLAVLTSGSKKPDREAAYQGASAGTLDVLVGTQALIQEGLGFRRLGLAVVDEQHRFGVVQRTALRHKGGAPHLLVMTATPIPRTLALTLHGDLDLSIIDELPPGRQEIKSHLLGPLERTLAYEHVRREVRRGRQAFIICPLVEDSPHLEARAATAEYERLKSGDLAGLRLALLHGRMRPAEKDRIMLEFKNGEHDVLVSTSVVEVGIDVPNATVMLVEGAERFGLAQLHQFRGRVGRGPHPSSCILLSDTTNPEALERLATVVAVSDGFRLADEDLRLRGPGEYFGTRQSGFPELRVADLRDLELVEATRAAASRLLERDPDLSLPEHAALAERLSRFRAAGSS
jgi:ATP-dependent DNA helicase RecG